MSDQFFERVETPDGSVTFRDTALGVTYRSVHGAQSESRYVFLEGTKLSDRGSPWRVLELGFGTGMNFATTLRASMEAGVELEYLSMEPALMPSDHWQVESEWKNLLPGEAYRIGRAQLTVVPSRWQDFEPETGWFDACYHDPFGPSVAPECWEQDVFEWSARALKEDGVLATFGAASATRWAMKKAGYLVAKLPGVPPKREMTIASKNAQAISHGKPWKRD